MSTDKSGKEGRQEMLNKVRNTADKVEEQLHKCKKNINDLSMAIASLNDEYVELEAKEAQCVKDMQTTLQSSVLTDLKVENNDTSKKRERSNSNDGNRCPAKKNITKAGGKTSIGTDKDPSFLKDKYKKHDNIDDSFRMYHPNAQEDWICSVDINKLNRLSDKHKTFLQHLNGKTLVQCKQIYEMEYSKLSKDLPSYKTYNGATWHQYHCKYNRTQKGQNNHEMHLMFTPP